MSITAIIKKTTSIVANTTAITRTQSQPAIELKNNVPSISQNYLHNLLDVKADDPADGYTLVYNANTRTYDVTSFAKDIDGGSF
jgi:hypothetical protein